MKFPDISDKSSFDLNSLLSATRIVRRFIVGVAFATSQGQRDSDQPSWATWKSFRRIDAFLALFKRKVTFFVLEFREISILLILGEGEGGEKKKRKKREFRRQEDAAGVLSARRDAIRESFEKVAIIKRAVPSVVPQ